MQREAISFSVAAVRPDSDLPQLDKDFDYEIPDEFRSRIGIGSEVSIRIGKASTPIRGFVTQLKVGSTFAGKLSAIESCSPFPMVTEQILSLSESLAARHACNLAEVLKLVVPVPASRTAARLVRNEAPGEGIPVAGTTTHAVKRQDPGTRVATAVECSLSGFTEYFKTAAAEAKVQQLAGRGTLVLAADERTQELIQKIFEEQGVTVNRYSSSLTRTKRYESYVDALLGNAQVFIGGRSASLLPITKLAKVIVWDEGDQNFVDKAAPYLQVRETIALRQQIEGFDVDYAAHVPSISLTRWISTGFVEQSGKYESTTKISFQESNTKFGRQSVEAIKSAISNKANALVVVATPGFTDVFYCANCNERASCRFCSGSIRSTTENVFACRICNAPEPRLVCRVCSSSEFDSGAGGANRVSQELGKLFPGTQIMESTGAKPIRSAQKSGCIFVSTPGVTPFDPRGYAAIVFLEASRYLRREGFYAREEAFRIWANTIGYAAKNARVVFEGIPQKLGQALSLWNQSQLAADELQERSELGFPPVNRMASITGSVEALNALADSLLTIPGIKVLGITIVDDARSQVEQERKLVISYPHKLTADLAKRLREEQLKLVGKVLKNKRSGRAVRPLRINMDDMKVI